MVPSTSSKHIYYMPGHKYLIKRKGGKKRKKKEEKKEEWPEEQMDKQP